MMSVREYVFVLLVCISFRPCLSQLTLRSLDRKLGRLSLAYQEDVLLLKSEIRRLDAELLREKEKTEKLEKVLYDAGKNTITDLSNSTGEVLVFHAPTKELKKLQKDVEVLSLAFSNEKERLKKVENHLQVKFQPAPKAAARNPSELDNVNTNNSDTATRPTTTTKATSSPQEIPGPLVQKDLDGNGKADAVIQTCKENHVACDRNARCVDFPSGFCCECLPSYIGNGNHCLDPGNAHTLYGTVSGVLNGVKFENLGIRALVKDRRVSLKVRLVPEEISAGMMTLNTISGVIGWMFAPISGLGTVNGFMLTGGRLNMLAKIEYQSGGQVEINQTFYGINEPIDIFINGSTPQIKTSIKVLDYTEEFSRAQPGMIRSESVRTYQIGSITQTYTVDQTIEYDECMNNPNLTDPSTTKLAATPKYVIYDKLKRSVKYVLSYAVSKH